jgi:16S rRNA (guanine966-N2)-methyltransferase
VSGGIRIVGGRFKGRRLKAGESVRPTSERAREALFDILGASVVGSDFLDLFAGSGAVGLEALSRGAASVTLVDRNLETLEQNRGLLGEVAASSIVIAADASAATPRNASAFDIVFADPPYEADLSILNGPHIVSRIRPGGRLIVQTDRGSAVPAPPGFRLERVAKYGRNVLHFLRRET